MNEPLMEDDEPEDDETKDDEPRDEKQSSEHRDDASLFGASSDYAQRGTTDQYSGGGPADSIDNNSAGRHGAGNNAGSQEDWRGGAGESAKRGVDTGDGRTAEAYGDVPSRSADPGQSSYGGFKNQGHAEHDALQQKASDRASKSDESDEGSDRSA